ncbi:MAG: DNA-directed RNA polymerase subunit omega [Acidobacteria bacterium]|nr:DNA-directed RNA polymerase subunit omega [Acidobacteriota bacterium]
MEIDTEQPEETATPESAEPAPFIHNRFLFVDIAAQRARQLRRGARPRLDHAPDHHPLLHKAERVAMEEVRRQKVYFDLPPAKSPARTESKS